MFISKFIKKFSSIRPFINNIVYIRKVNYLSKCNTTHLTELLKSKHNSNKKKFDNSLQKYQYYLPKCSYGVKTMEVTYLETPDKSENDKKHYKTLLLGNGLHILLVSDPTAAPYDCSSSSGNSSVASITDESSEMESMSSTQSSAEDDDDCFEGDEMLAACALLIDYGSFSEPTKYPGLAHFLEHMIFMGSEKFPEENAFDVHIKNCGGFDNAHTESEETVFYFEVGEEHLDSSMDCFSALFKAPLMKKEAMTRERDAVDSEFDQTQNDDEARRDQLLASLANEGFPHGKFAWGNKKSLKENIDEQDLHRTLHDVRERHYSANRMYLCVQARLPIDELENIAIKHFADIPSNNLPGSDFSQFNYKQAFCENFHKDVFFVKSIANLCKLELTWVLPSMTKYYKCKPEHFISFILGYEGEGSLCAYLRKRLWGLDLIAGPDDSGFDTNSIYTLFNLCIVLTDDGLKHIDEVLAATFSYVKLLNTKFEELEEVYNNLKSIESTSFRFQEQKPAFDNVQNLVTQSKRFPPKDILTGMDIYFEYNKEQVKEVVDHLNDFRFNIMITSKGKCEGVVYDKEEKWFGTQYGTINMPEKWKNLWENCVEMPELFLPESNTFISDDFRLFWVEDGKPELPAGPKKILQSDVCELWFRQDDKFLLPHATMYFHFISPLPRQSVKNDVMSCIYAEMIKFCLAEELYPATVAGLTYDFSGAEKGVVLKVNGYNQKVHRVVNIIINAMTNIDCHSSQAIFDVLKMKILKQYYNILIKPAKLNKDIRLSIVHNKHWPLIDKYMAIRDVTLNDIINFSKIYTDQLYIKCLMQGNMTEEQAHNVMNSVLTAVNSKRITEHEFIEDRILEMPKGSNYVRIQALNNQDNNTVVCNFYQIGPNTLRTESILDLLMMFIEEPFYATLRSLEQLGYSVSTSVRINYGIVGYTLIINSQENKYEASYVDERIEAFRNTVISIIKKQTAKEYEHVRKSLIKSKQVVDMALYEEVNRNWGEIHCGEYFFDRRRKEVEVLRTISKEDIIQFCLENERTNLRKLSIQIIGNSKVTTSEDKENEKNSNLEDDAEDIDEKLLTTLNLNFITNASDVQEISNINDFKNTLNIYPVTKTIIDENATKADIIENIVE
ncbi:nardilysin [Teleopsis dalmanni]|uniref:nardilysin n=1 Tax=Teleopsis dalmanni TaxID=139649 RepID=UPI0018CCA44F|nr:nardilysin [Teleopsis dalmanni]